MVPRFRLVTDAASEPLTLADAKAYARVDASDEDALLTALIKSARRYVERETGLALLTQTWTAVLDRWPDQGAGGLADNWWDGVRQAPLSAVMAQTGVIQINKRPFQAVTSIQLRDAYGGLTTVDPTIYFTEASDMRGRIVRKLGSVWPIVVLAPSGAIEITFTAGFDNALYGSAVPDDILTCMKMLVKHHYDFRDAMEEGRAVPIPHHISSLIGHYRNTRLG